MFKGLKSILSRKKKERQNKTDGVKTLGKPCVKNKNIKLPSVSKRDRSLTWIS